MNDVVTAHGVEFMKNNRRQLVNARKEVILSAGAINSPQLLMLSGIGPRKHLESLNIPVFRDLKVSIGTIELSFIYFFFLNSSTLIRTKHWIL